jgi:hypothetical protein
VYEPLYTLLKLCLCLWHSTSQGRDVTMSMYYNEGVMRLNDSPGSDL